MLSIIIPTYNGKNKVLNLLKSIEDQIEEGFEVIVMIDGSTDGTYESLNEYKINKPWLIVVYQKNQGRAIVRNNGVKLATHKLILLIDDDMILSPFLLQHHISFHESHMSSFLVGAIYDSVTELDLDFVKFRSYLSYKWDKQIKIDENKRLISSFMSAGHLSFYKDLFWELGGFNEALTDLEDLDLKIRCYEKDIPVYYDSKIICWHTDKFTCKRYIKRTREYKQSFKKLMTQYPKKYKVESEKRVIRPSKKLFLSLFKNDIWVELIDKDKFLFLPKRIRYKLYDWVVTGHTLQ
ncbi:MAG: glycosyltransferase [Cytophagaceae bacterium]|jgi:glycosyltransferase involved in cell wall biosynthesis|nr:glycosyltransferase [Cytophagaceae bacterium]